MIFQKNIPVPRTLRKMLAFLQEKSKIFRSLQDRKTSGFACSESDFRKIGIKLNCVPDFGLKTAFLMRKGDCFRNLLREGIYGIWENNVKTGNLAEIVSFHGILKSGRGRKMGRFTVLIEDML